MTRNKKICKKLIYPLIVLVSVLFLVLVSSCGSEGGSIDAPISCNLDMSDEEYKVKWSTESTAKLSISVTENGQTKKLSYLAKSYKLDPSAGNEYKIEVFYEGNEKSKKTVEVEFLNPFNKDDISAYLHDEVIDITLNENKYTEYNNLDYCFKVNGKETIQKSNVISIAKTGSNKVSAAVQYKVENDESGEYKYAFAEYSTTFDINPQPADIKMEPKNSNYYMLECEENQVACYSSFDVSLSSSEGIIFEQDGVVANQISSAVEIDPKTLPEENLTLNVKCHGKKTAKVIYCDYDYEKVIKYRKNGECTISGGMIYLPETKDTIEYQITREPYGLKAETLKQTGTSAVLSSGLPYKYTVLPKYTDDSFTRPAETEWFEFATAPKIVCDNAYTYSFKVESNMNVNNYVTTIGIYKDGELLATKEANNLLCFSLAKEVETIMQEEGMYEIKAFTAPITDLKQMLPNGESYTLISSTENSFNIYRSGLPTIEKQEKVNNGRDYKITVKDNSQVYFTCGAFKDQKFTVEANATQTYIFSREMLTAYATSNQEAYIYSNNINQTADTIVLPSKTIVLGKFSSLGAVPANMTLTNHTADRKNYFEYTVDQKGNYFAELYYVNTDSSLDFIGDTYFNGNEFCIDDVFGDKERLAGQYLVNVERVSDNVFELNSDIKQYRFKKIGNPTFDSTASTPNNIVWTINTQLNDIDGYSVVCNGIVVYENTQVSGLQIYRDELPLGETVYQIYAFKAGALRSEPLEIKLYKLPEISVSSTNGNVVLNNKIEGFTYHLNYYITAKNVSGFVPIEGSGDELDLVEITNRDAFKVTDDVTYNLHLSLTGQGNGYQFIYGNEKDIEFVKKGIPDVNLDSTANRNFVFSIGSTESFRPGEEIDSVKGELIGKRVYFKTLGNGEWVIDSCIIMLEYS